MDDRNIGPLEKQRLHTERLRDPAPPRPLLRRAENLSGHWGKQWNCQPVSMSAVASASNTPARGPTPGACAGATSSASPSSWSGPGRCSGGWWGLVRVELLAPWRKLWGGIERGLLMPRRHPKVLTPDERAELVVVAALKRANRIPLSTTETGLLIGLSRQGVRDVQERAFRKIRAELARTMESA